MGGDLEYIRLFLYKNNIVGLVKKRQDANYRLAPGRMRIRLFMMRSFVVLLAGDSESPANQVELQGIL